MKFIIPVESMKQNKGGVIIYNPIKNKIEQQYIHSQREDIPRSGWRGGTLYNGYMICTDWTDLHYFDVQRWKYITKATKNTFNDLHYLSVQNNILYIVNTGLDAIEEFNNPLNPKFHKFRFVFNSNKSFTKRDIKLNNRWNTKYKVKPHSCHPNCICPINDNLLVTCFEDQSRKEGTGSIVNLKTGKFLMKNVNCHDGNFYKKDFYLSWTRKSKILVIKNIMKRKWPLSIDTEINIGKPGWWRGMIIHKDHIYIFSSHGYKNSGPCRLAIIKMKNGKVTFKKIPKLDIVWDTIYEPILFEG